MTAQAPRRSPLDAVHRDLGARMVAYAGYEMPLRYGSELEEHRTVRSAVGLFDLSHMGEIRIDGPQALELARFALVSDPGALEPWQAQYSMLCAEDGGVIDDLIVYRLDPGYLVVCNAANRDAVLAHLHALLAERGYDAEIDDRSDATALIAPQGPAAAELLSELTSVDLAAIGNYRSARGDVAAVDCLVARTGYTGEDGFELFCEAEQATSLWEALVATGERHGLRPCGLASRDTLRLEAGMPLYGNELDRSINPYEANLGRVVKLDKGDFVGREALAAIHAAGPRRRLVGLVMTGEGIARHGYPVVDGGESPAGGHSADLGPTADGAQTADGDRSGAGGRIGWVTSGSLSPTLGQRIAMALVRAETAEVGRTVGVMIRDRRSDAEQVKLPFYRRPRPA